MSSIPPAELQAFLDGPSSVPPSGVHPNLENPPNRNDEALAVAVVCTLLTTTAVLARAYSRIVVLKKVHVEDFLCLGAFLCFPAILWCLFDFRDQAGFFVHQWDLPGSVLIHIGLESFVIGTSYSLLMSMLKTAILKEWIRIFVPTGNRNLFFWAGTTLMGLNIGVYSSAVLSELLGCRPLQKEWYFWLEGSCIDNKSRDMVLAAFNLIMDVSILVLPQRAIWNLRMSRKRKLGISIIFSVGLLVVAIAAGRLYGVIILQYPTDLTKPYDTTYLFSQMLLWVVSETTCVFLVFCVPSLPKIFVENGVVSGLVSSWRSWTRLGLISSSKSSERTQHPPTIGSLPSTPRASERAYRITEDEDQSSLTELAVMRDQYIKHANGVEDRKDDGEIIKTIEFDRRDDAASKTSTDNFLERQHPWMGHS